MINLLPPDVKQNIAYGRLNTRLLRWSTAFFVGIAGIGVIVAFGLFYINSSVSSYTAQVEQARSELKIQKLDETQKEVEEISSNLKLAVQVLSREILFSKLFRQIGAAIPANAILTDLALSKVEGGLDLEAIATDYDTATQVQLNLQDPANQIFDSADLVRVACSSSATTDPRYPCTVTIRARFAKNNPFLFINNSGATP